MIDLTKLEELTSVGGVAGDESQAMDVFHKLTKYSERVKQYKDGVGNHYTEIPGRGSDKRIMFTAHMDTIGFMVKYIDDQGFVFTQDITGYEMADPRMLPGTDVVIYSRKSGKTISGQFMPVIPYHLVDEGTDDEILQERYEIAIDIGSKGESQTKRVVSVGDYVSLKHRFVKLGDRISATHLDDRLGAYVLYEIGKYVHSLRSGKVPTVILAATAGEEGSTGASGLTAKSAQPDISITIDVLPATDTIVYDAEYEVYKKHGKCRLDDGPAIGRGLGISDDVFMALESACEKNNMPYQIELSRFDTDNGFINARGIRTGLVLVPVRNVHTAIETCSPKDIEATIKLCKKYTKMALK